MMYKLQQYLLRTATISEVLKMKFAFDDAKGSRQNQICGIVNGARS